MSFSHLLILVIDNEDLQNTSYFQILLKSSYQTYFIIAVVIFASQKIKIKYFFILFNLIKIKQKYVKKVIININKN